jgi:hypothetical protein
VNGDFYIDTSSSTLYGPKTASGWGTGVSLKGNNGTNGTNGNTILNGSGLPDNSLGANGDFYIDTASSTMYGPKAAGAWPPSGVSLKGATGAAGNKVWTGSAAPTNTTPAGSTNASILPDLMQWQTTPLVYNSTDATFDGTTSKFTVNTTGTYLFNVQVMSTVTACYPIFDMNDTGWSTSSIYGYPSIVTTQPLGYQYRGFLNAIVPLTAGDFFKVRLSAQSAIAGCTTTAGGTWMTVTRLN